VSEKKTETRVVQGGETRGLGTEVVAAAVAGVSGGVAGAVTQQVMASVKKKPNK
jgi:hypothetical protein